MSWPYHFISLSEDDKLRRQVLLDLRGFYAQVSIVLVISVVRFIRLTTKSTKEWDGPVSGKTRRYLVCGLWLSWLIGLAMWNTGDGMSQFHKLLRSIRVQALTCQIRLPSFDQSIGPSGPVSTATAGSDVSSRHL
jgi:hypothetical protein